MTPQYVAKALVEALNPSGSILEPCCGDGSFSVELAKYGLVKTCDIANGDVGFSWWSEQVDWIVTNPPWSQFRVFLEHAMEIAPNIAMLITVNHWWTKRRVRSVREAGYGYKRLFLCEWPVEWHATGFQLGLMHIARGHTGPLEIAVVKYSRGLNV